MSDKTATLPELMVQDALQLAVGYLKENQIRIDHRRLGVAKWDFSTVTEQWSWYLYWMTADELHKLHHHADQSDHAQLVVNVTDDGRVSHTLG